MKTSTLSMQVCPTVGRTCQSIKTYLRANRIMYTSIMFFFAILITQFSYGQGTMGRWEMCGLTGTTASVTATGTLANVTFSALTRGAGLTGASSTDGFSSTGWSTAGGLDITQNDYYEFTITPATGYKMSITSLKIRDQVSTTASSFDAYLRYSQDAYASNLSNWAASTSLTNRTITLSGNTNLQNRTTPVTFRIYGSDASSATTTTYLLNCLGTAAGNFRGVDVDGTVAQLAYASQFISMSTGSTSWCAGETRNISVTVKNVGSATWTNAGPDVNIGVKWNTNGANWTDYHVRTDAGNLAPGVTQTYNFTITASNATAGPVYGTGLNAGTNNLTFDIFKEGDCWFGTNVGTCGPGNSVFTSPNQTIVALPTITKGANPSGCPFTSAGLSYSATTGTPNQYSIDYDAAANTAGFVDVVNAILPATPIPMAIPGGTAAGTYNATLSVRNSTTGCSGTPVAIAVTVLSTPFTTGVTICQGGSGSLTSSTSCPGFVNSGTTISGSWTAATDPTANRLNGGINNTATCAFESPAVSRNYVAQNFQVSATGSYIIEMNSNGSYDAMGYIVTGAFVPGTCPGTGTFVRGDDDSGGGDEPSMTATLTAGITYTLISTTYNASAGTYSGSFVWTVTPPAGEQIMLPVSTAVQWYTTSSGGTAFGSGSPFNPVGVAGSGLANTNTPGTTVFYAACIANPACRTATNFVINPNTSISLTSGSASQSACKNAPMTSVIFTIGNGGTGASITSGALPAGVTGIYNAGLFTISGTPTVSGSFSYTITTSGGLCAQSTANGTINVNNPPTATFTKTMASSCGSGNDGTITVTPTGNSPFTYNWSSTPGGFSANTAAVTGLTSRDYTVVVTDANLCSVTIPDITIWKALSAVVTNNGGGSGSCSNTGYIILYGSGGVQPFTYSVDGTNYFVSNSFTGLAAGTYTGYVKDFGGCVSTKPGIVVTGAATIVVTANTRPATSCANNGTIELFRTGGMPPYTYSLNDITYQGGNTFNNLAGATTYIGWVKDAAGCKTSLAGIVVGKAPLITVSVTKLNTSPCSNSGSLIILAGGGVPGYTYSITGANGTYQASNAFTGLAAGTYDVWVKDSKGCKQSKFTNVIGTNTAPAITVTANPRSASSCANNGSVELFRTGGSGPFTYSLNNITYQAGNTFTGLAAGTFTGWVKDVNGCTGSSAGIIVTQSPAVTVTEKHTNTSTCVNDATIQLTPGGGVPGYTYSLDNITYQAGNSYTGLAAGNYTGWTKDSKGCTASVPVTLGTNAAIVVTSYAVNATSCAATDGSIQLFRTGGTSPFTYSLDNVTYQAGNTFTGLIPGMYTGYIKDSKGCIGSMANISVGPSCPQPFALTDNKVNDVPNIGNEMFFVNVYPNPTAAEFNLVLTSSNNEKVSIIVTDNLGRKVYRSGSVIKNQISFGKNFRSGIYTVEVIQGSQKKSIKIIKE